MEPVVPDVIAGDPGRLRQIILNLVGNAVKFTKTGQVVIECGLWKGDGEIKTSGPWTEFPVEEQMQGTIHNSKDIMLHFCIRDTGIGIPPDRLAAIFDMFIQADASTTRQYGGAGLGLSICKQLVGMMGGRIWAESEPGKGSAFHFTSRFGVGSMTDFAKKSDWEQWLAAGVDGYVPKPPNETEFMETVAELTPETSSTADRVMPMAIDSKETLSRKAVDISAALEKIGGDKSALMEAVNRFIKEGSHQIEELNVAISNQDKTGAEHHARLLKAMASDIGANEIADEAFRIQLRARQSRMSECTSLVKKIQEKFGNLSTERFSREIEDIEWN